MKIDSLYGRIAISFALILLMAGGLLGWIGYDAAKAHQHEVLQRISHGVAERIAVQAGGALDVERITARLDQLTAVNPNIEAYLLDTQGRVLRASPADAVPTDAQVSLAPIRAFLGGRRLPIRGDNPRNPQRPGVFSAAALERDGTLAGYVYLVLLSDMYHDMVADAWRGYVLRSTGWFALGGLLFALLAGLAVFAWITRRLNRLTREVEAFRGSTLGAPEPGGDGDEIERLGAAFGQMRARLDRQMGELRRQDELRRELVANVSHDLRTPLTSMLGYLETLVKMDRSFSDEQRREYLEVAVRQSRKVARLAQQLFELARLECEETLPEPELFPIGELVQDIAQKFALTAQQKGVHLTADTTQGDGLVRGDIGMIERVISNLVENAIRHTPNDGEIRLETHAMQNGIEVRVADTGQGIASEHLPGLFERDSPLRVMAHKRGGGLGLLIANRILTLHGTVFHAASQVGRGTTLSFVLPLAQVA